MSARNPEMSRAQFRKALERNQLQQVLLWIRDTSGKADGFSWGIIMHANGKPAYRATLGRVLRERRSLLEKQGLEI